MAKSFGYVHSFVIPVPRKNLGSYRKWVKALSSVLKENGVISYVECISDGATKGYSTSFSRSVKLKAGEVVILCFATFKSKAHSQRAMKKTMSDERLSKFFMSPSKMLFDGDRMFWGDFKVFYKGK